jgi:hypothetical protein
MGHTKLKRLFWKDLPTQMLRGVASQQQMSCQVVLFLLLLLLLLLLFHRHGSLATVAAHT